MALKRVALIFDNLARPETTGVYCRRALGELVEVDHFLPADLPRMPRGYDLYLRIDDGFAYELPDHLRPCAVWAIDTHLNFDQALKLARHYDIVFAAQRDGAAKLKQAGIADCHWLPLACDPELHFAGTVTKDWDWCFVGNLFPGERQEHLNLLQHIFPNSWVGQRYFHAMARTFAASRIVFNRSLRNDINMRVFEALASGSLLVTNDLTENGQPELLKDGVHLATYRDTEGLLKTVQYFLDHDEEREQLAAAGRAEVLARHTYRHRMESLLQRVEDWQERRRDKPTKPDSQTRSVTADALPTTPFGGKIKSLPYFEHSRPEVLALVPPLARRVLDIGCGGGRLGESIKSRQAAEVVGIELHPDAIGHAQQRLDKVLAANIEDSDTDFEAGRFDCIIAADVLEHLREPVEVLQRIHRWLTPDGHIVLSLPNVQHHSILSTLAEGNWTYESAGLLDSDHVRFFTRREIEKLLYRTGFQIRDFKAVAGPGHAEWVNQGRPGEITAGRLKISGLSREEAQEFHVYQYLVTAQPRPAATLTRRRQGLTSIIIVTFNQVGYTRECVDSLRLRTDEPYELIFVDNASTDGTREYLQSLPGAHVILNSENRGFPAAVNQGLNVARGDTLLLLNNDTVATTGWLGRMLDVFDREPHVGLVGPCSNRISGEQQVQVTYQDLASLDGFAWDWGRRHAEVIEDTDRLVGFCLLIRRELMDQIGQLDERFGIGCFEDDDYCRRALQAGYRCVIARDSFVHHFGSRSFAGANVDLGQVLLQNQRLYEAKWAQHAPPNHLTAPLEVQTGGQAARRAEAPRPASMPATLVAAPGDARACAPRQPGSVRISLCMITRNNEQTIGPALASIRPYVDEIIVVDTGSTDRTMEICRQHGARVEQFPWIDDFATARNESLKYAKGEWIFWMDSDDTITPACGRALRELVDGRHGWDVLGYVMQVHCPSHSAGSAHDLTVVDHVKLFRNRSDLQFEFRIHEQIIPAIRRAGGNVLRTDLYVVHSGSDQTPEGRKRKLERDYRILHRELADHPDHPFVLFNLGMTYADEPQYDEAIRYLTRCVEVSHPDESHLRKAYALLVGAYYQSERPDQAWTACQHGLQLYPEDLELRFRAGILHHALDRHAEAIQAYESVLAAEAPSYFSSIDPGLRGFKARQNLAAVFEDLGQLEQAERQWRLITTEVPSYASGWHGLGENLLRQGRDDEVRGMVRFLRETKDLRKSVAGMLAARLAVKAGSIQQAMQELLDADRHAPEQLDAWRMYCQLAFEHAEPQIAEAALEELARRCPFDGSAHHNLGTISMQRRDFARAKDCFKNSLQLRPGAPQTWLHLGYALRALGKFAEARDAFRSVLRLDPSHEMAQTEINELDRQRTGN